jgi:hypothetical protein
LARYYDESFLLQALQIAKPDDSIFAFCPIHDQPDEADNVSGALGHPELLRTHAGKVLIKAQSGIVAADGGIVIDLPVALRPLGPYRPARFQIRRLIGSES